MGIPTKPNYAQFSERKFAYLNESFGRAMAQLWLGLDNEMIEALVGRFSRGKRKGQLRGSISWKKCIRGGWSYRGVVLPGTISEVSIVDSFTHETFYEHERQSFATPCYAPNF